jgi:hypothetical protein
MLPGNVYCPNCGRANQFSSVSCPGCGLSLKFTTPLPPEPEAAVTSHRVRLKPDQLLEGDIALRTRWEPAVLALFINLRQNVVFWTI